MHGLGYPNDSAAQCDLHDGIAAHRAFPAIPLNPAISIEELREGQWVEFSEGRGPKGPRAENVKVI